MRFSSNFNLRAKFADFPFKWIWEKEVFKI